VDFCEQGPGLQVLDGDAVSDSIKIQIRAAEGALRVRTLRDRAGENRENGSEIG